MIKQTTIDKYVRYLNVLKQNEGKIVKIGKINAAIGVSSSAHFYAKKYGLIDFDGKTGMLGKVYYKTVEPITARKFIEKMNLTYSDNPAPVAVSKPLSDTPKPSSDIVKKATAKKDSTKQRKSPSGKAQADIGFEIRLFGKSILSYSRRK